MWASARYALRLEDANSQMLALAETDLLTNLANRRAFLKRLTQAFAASQEGAAAVCRALYRHRRLQGRERHPRPSDGRRVAPGDRRAAKASLCARTTSSLASAAMSSPFSNSTLPISAAVAALATRIVGLMAQALRCRRTSPPHHLQHRHLGVFSRAVRARSDDDAGRSSPFMTPRTRAAIASASTARGSTRRCMSG